jgi:hypothetical protein
MMKKLLFSVLLLWLVNFAFAQELEDLPAEHMMEFILILQASITIDNAIGSIVPEGFLPMGENAYAAGNGINDLGITMLNTNRNGIVEMGAISVRFDQISDASSFLSRLYFFMEEHLGATFITETSMGQAYKWGGLNLFGHINAPRRNNEGAILVNILFSRNVIDF